MKKVLVVLLLLAAMQVAHAVDLQEGWYAWFGGVYLEGINPNTGLVHTPHWSPSTSLGQYGPVEVTLWNGYSDSRKATVSALTSVAPGVLFEDVGSYTGGGLSYPYVYLSWATDYDGGKMRLQLLRRRDGQADELVWEQEGSGYQVGDGGNIWDSSPVRPGDELVFRLVAVPEPMSIATLAFGMSALCWKLRRRRE